MLTPALKQNDKTASLLIWALSFVVFGAVVFLKNFKPLEGLDLGFNVHIFAFINAILNGTVSVLLVLALVAAKKKNFTMHRNIMYVSIILSVLFLVSYIAHHLFAGETKYGGAHDWMYFTYLFILISHIGLATIILPFILYTAYRALTGEYSKHKKLAKLTWPLWLYVSVTGVLVFWLISPYYIPHL